jgi:glucosamine--fructose-6-phosphate aminotransferase (isomerizing)
MSQTLFLQDILNTASSIQETLRGIGDGAETLAALLLERGARRFVAIGNGTSLYASMASVYLHNAFVGPEVTLAWAAPTGEYALYPAPLSAHDAVVGVSVSGEVVDLLDVCDRMRGSHQLVGVTNAPQSSLTRLADHVLLTRAGDSMVPTSTKTFAASVAALHLLWLGLLRAQGVADAARLRDELLAIPALVAESIDLAVRRTPDVADRLASCRRLFVCGAGPSWAVAQEAALVFKEVANLPAEAVHTREMAHGTTAVVDASAGVIAINPPGAGQDLGRRILAQCAALGAPTVEVGETTSGLPVDARCDDLLSPQLYSSPLFILADRVAERRGVDTDHPSWEEEYLRTTRRGAQ